MAVSNFGFRPAPGAIRQNVRLYVSHSVRREMVRQWVELVRMARSGQVIGIACTVLLADGTTDMIAIGSLSGLRAMASKMQFSPLALADRRKSATDRRRQHRPPSLEGHAGHSS